MIFYHRARSILSRHIAGSNSAKTSRQLRCRLIANVPTPGGAGVDPTCYRWPFNMTDLPALSVPFTFSSEQLPINVQLVSRWLDEATILRLGSLIEAGNKAQHRHPNL